MADPSTFDRLLDPVRYPPDAGGDLLAAVALAVVIVAGGLWAIRAVLRKLGPGDGMLDLHEAPIALGLGVALLILPAALFHAMVGGSPTQSPLMFGLLQTTLAIASIVILALYSRAGRDSAPRDWVRFRSRWLPRTLLAWVLAYPMLNAAIFVSVVALQAADVPVTEQGLITELREQRTVLWIVGWYVMAGVAAPLAEEFAFRVALFGGLRRWLQPAGRAAPWIAGSISVGAFVLAHGVVSFSGDTASYPVLALPLVCLAVVLTLCYAHTKSMWPGAIIHALHNTLVVTLQFFVVN